MSSTLGLDDTVFVNGAAIRRRTLLGYLSGAIGAGALSAATGVIAANQPGAVLNVGADANPSSLDPATGGAGSDHVFLFPIYDTLVTWTYESLEARPGLAKSWKFTDPKTLVLELREGVVFHDGALFNAEAVKVNLDRSRSAEFSNIRADLGSVDQVTVDGEHVVTLHLKEADTALPLILSDRAGMMVSPKALAANGNRVDRHPVGAGFMQFVKWDDGSQVVLTANPQYYERAGSNLGGITLKIMTDSATRLRSVQSGQAALAYALNGRQLPLLKKMPKLRAVTGPTLYCYQLYLNLSRKTLADKRVRQALNLAVDRETFVKGALAGAGEAAYMNLPINHWAYDPKTAELYKTSNPDRAKALLKEAGYPDGVTYQIAGYNDQSSVQMQEIIQHQLNSAGIHARFVTGTIAEMSAAYFARGEHDMLLSAWTGRPDPSLTYSLMYPKASYFNAGHVAPPEAFTQGLQASRSTDDIEGRKKALAQVQYAVMSDALVVPLAFREGIVATSDKVENFKPDLLGKPKFEHVSLQS